MKKLLFILTMVLCGFAAQASDLDVKSGSAKPLKDGGDIFVTFDFKGCKWDKSEPIEDHYGNFANMIKRVPNEFGRKFKKECKRSSIVTDRDNAKWDVTIKIQNMDSYYNVMGWGPAGHVTKIDGTITIKDVATGETQCVIEIDELDGGRNIVPEESFHDAFEELGEEFAKLMNKGK